MSDCAEMAEMAEITSELLERMRAILDGGGGEAFGDARFVPLVTLESEARCGLELRLETKARLVWVSAPSDGRPLVRAEPGQEHLLYEVLETKRDDFEDRLAEGALAAGLPAEATVLAFPAIAVVRAVLAKEHAYLSRLALQWLLPSELRELRVDILRVIAARDMPTPVKDLAKRLVVPE